MTYRQADHLVKWQSALAFLTFMAGAGTIGGVIPEQISAVFCVIVGGLQAGTAVYVSGIRREAGRRSVTLAHREELQHGDSPHPDDVST